MTVISTDQDVILRESGRRQARFHLALAGCGLAVMLGAVFVNVTSNDGKEGSRPILREGIAIEAPQDQLRPQIFYLVNDREQAGRLEATLMDASRDIVSIVVMDSPEKEAMMAESARELERYAGAQIVDLRVR